MNGLTIDELREIVAMVVENQLDHIEFNGLKIHKSRHISKTLPQEQEPRDPFSDPDMYYAVNE